MSDEPEVRVEGIRRMGDPRDPETKKWTMLPPPPGVCSQCAVDHDPALPHDQQSLHYQYAFYAEHERWPNWGDAVAHCTPEIQAAWTSALRDRGVPPEDLQAGPTSS